MKTDPDFFFIDREIAGSNRYPYSGPLKKLWLIVQCNIGDRTGRSLVCVSFFELVNTACAIKFMDFFQIVSFLYHVFRGIYEIIHFTTRFCDFMSSFKVSIYIESSNLIRSNLSNLSYLRAEVFNPSTKSSRAGIMKLLYGSLLQNKSFWSSY